MRLYEGRTSGDNHFSCPTGHSCFVAASGTVGLLSYMCTLQAHVLLLIHWNTQVLLCKSAPSELFDQSAHIPGITLAQMQYLALGFIESHLVHLGLHLKPVHIPLCGIPAFYCIICISHPGSLVSSTNQLRVHQNQLIMCLIKMLKSSVLKTDPSSVASTWTHSNFPVATIQPIL